MNRIGSRSRGFVRCVGAAVVAVGLGSVLAACADDDNQTRSPVETPQAAARLGQAALMARDFPAASGFYRRAIEGGVTNLDTQLGLAESLLGGGDLVDALRQYRYIQHYWPTRPEANLGIGRVFLGQHKPAAALAAFQAAEHQGDFSPALYNDEGISLDQLQRHDEAQAVYQRGLAVAADDKMLRSNYGLSLAISGKYSQAIQILTDIAEQPDATPRNRQNLALALGMAGDKEAARRVAAHDLSPDAVENNLRYYSAVRDSPGS